MIEPQHCSLAERKLREAAAAVSALKSAPGPAATWPIDAALFELDVIIDHVHEIAADMQALGGQALQASAVNAA